MCPQLATILCVVFAAGDPQSTVGGEQRYAVAPGPTETEDAGEAIAPAARKHVAELEEALLPILAALPHNRYGKLNPSAVRYALHSFFLRQRGWRVDGLDPEGAAWNSSSPSEAAIFDRLKAAGREAVAESFGEEGLAITDVVGLAATIERLVHEEADERLRVAFRMVDLPTSGTTTVEAALQAVYVYMSSYVVGADISRTPTSSMMKNYRRMDKIYPAWNATKHWLREMVANQTRGTAQAVTFAHVAKAVEEIGDRYGRWQNRECVSMKNELMSMEDVGTGRVPLSVFYGAALKGKWMFSESVQFLRANGALDESSPTNPRVIIPNYVNGMSNCIGASGYHSVCCISECQDIRGIVERKLGKPEASPEEIAALVATIPSATVVANRVIDPLLLLRLNRIAGSSNNGLVPIYGRLFAQWMHHAYPRECEYPHLAGSTRPKTVYDFLHSGKAKLVRSPKDEMRWYAASVRDQGGPIETLPWEHHEELLGGKVDTVPPLFFGFHGVVFVTMGVAFARMARLTLGRRCACGSSSEKAGEISLPVAV